MQVNNIRSVFISYCEVKNCSCYGGTATLRISHEGKSWNVCEDGGNMVIREITELMYESALEKM